MVTGDCQEERRDHTMSDGEKKGYFLSWFRKAKGKEHSTVVLPGEPVLRSSICTGERVAGYISTENGKFIDVMLIQNDEDLEVFRQTYGLSDHEIRTIY